VYLASCSIWGKSGKWKEEEKKDEAKGKMNGTWKKIAPGAERDRCPCIHGWCSLIWNT